MIHKLVLENKIFRKASDGVFEWKYEFSTHPENKFPNLETNEKRKELEKYSNEIFTRTTRSTRANS